MKEYNATRFLLLRSDVFVHLSAIAVIGGYLAFIGYFCLEAGVALCISEPMTTLSDWSYLLDPHSLLLATPGLLSAGILTLISRKASNDAILPLAMVIIPAVFYAVLYVSGVSLQDARDYGWVGEEAPPVPARELLDLVDFSLVHWALVKKCIGTWIGMVFVVSFASCLDIAAISMDMGEALDTNKEMVTVGTSNLMSGICFGFTGSYIFSQVSHSARLVAARREPLGDAFGQLAEHSLTKLFLSDYFYLQNWVS